MWMMSGMRERPLSGKVSCAICDRFWPVSDRRLQPPRRRSLVAPAGRERPLAGGPLTWHAFATPLLRQFHLAQERFVAGIRFEVLEQPVSLDEIKTRILLRVGAIEPSDCLIALGSVRM